MTVVYSYPHCTNVVKCNTNYDWSLFTDGEELKEGPDFQVQEGYFTYQADMTFSSFFAVPFRDYYNRYPNETR